MLRTISSILVMGLLASSGLLAADFWAAKPYTDWSAKDLQKMLTNSPWAHLVPVSMGGGRGAGGGGGRRGTGGGGMGEISSAGGGESIGGAGAANRRGAVSGDEGLPGSGNTPAVNVLIRWQSALPVKQAVLRDKYGAEAASSAEAKKFLDQDEPYYVVLFNNPVQRGGGGGGVDQATEMIKKSTMLRRKGKDPIYPEKVQFVPRQGAGVDIFLMFPKKDAIVEDDKDVEFVFQNPMLGEIKARFKLKDMMIGDKLAL